MHLCSKHLALYHNSYHFSSCDRQARLTASVTSPAAASGDVIEMLQRELAVTLLLEEKLDVAPQAISILQQHGLDEADEQVTLYLQQSSHISNSILFTPLRCMHT